MFGVVNALFSGLAFAGIIFTILLQRKELKYQREELSATRSEFITQNKTLKAQRFESTFFGLINLHNQIVNDMDYEYENIYQRTDNAKGRDVFYQAYRELLNGLDKGLNTTERNVLYSRMYAKHNTDFGHYFRNLYRIIKIIDETEFIANEELEENLSQESIDELYYKLNYFEKYRYTSIIRAQLSDYELYILFYDGLTKMGEKFKPLIEEYSLLKTMPKHFIMHKEHFNLYKPSAFEPKFKKE
jgi:hypothetical protein